MPPAPNGTGEVNGYVVEVRESGEDDADWDQRTVGAIDIANSTVTITDLIPGTSYDIRVAATNAVLGPPPTGGFGLYSYDTATPATVPDPVASIEVESGYKSLNIAWLPPDDMGSPITHYLVRYAIGRANLVAIHRGSSRCTTDHPLTHRLVPLLRFRVWTLWRQRLSRVGSSCEQRRRRRELG